MPQESLVADSTGTQAYRVTISLNPEQSEAAEHGEGPALVLAGPGTGKTTTLLGRYLSLLGKGVQPETILTMTFSRKAADQLVDRLRDLSGLDASDLPIGTFHSQALRMLDEAERLAGRTNPVRVVEKWQPFRIVRSLRSRGDPPVEDLLESITRWKDRLISPAKAAAEAASEEQMQTARIYNRYQRHLSARKLLDFGDMAMKLLEQFACDEPLRARFAARYRYMMVDEFQDVNPAQVALIRALLPANRNLWVVGDDDQSIYGWRGSDIRYIIDFERTYPGARIVRLTRNYRSRPNILTVANTLILHNDHRLGKELISESRSETRVVLYGARDEIEEASWIAESVSKLLASGVPATEISILVRTNFLTVPFESALQKRKIAYIIAGGRSLWELPEVLALLEAVDQASKGRSRLELRMDFLNDPVSEALRRARTPTYRDIVKIASEAIALRAPGGSERKIQWAGSVLQVATMALEFDCAEDLAVFAHQQRGEARDQDGDRVTLSTIHQAKGLEWSAVFLAACEVGTMPHALSEDFEEERRLAFVALTRAKDYLIVSFARERGGRSVEPSPFIAELSAGPARDLFDRRGLAAAWEPGPARGPVRRRGLAAARKSAPAGSSAAPVKAPGSWVRHPDFGRGFIVEVVGDNWGVRFEDGTIQLIKAAYFA